MSSKYPITTAVLYTEEIYFILQGVGVSLINNERNDVWGGDEVVM